MPTRRLERMALAQLLVGVLLAHQVLGVLQG
jgi:hypothetical protein